MEGAFEYARRSALRAAERQKRHYDTKATSRRCNIGDWVWYYYPPKAQGKLSKGWSGPYLVLDKPTDLHYVIQETERGRPRRVHGDYLKPYLVNVENIPENWVHPKPPPVVIDGLGVGEPPVVGEGLEPVEPPVVGEGIDPVEPPVVGEGLDPVEPPVVGEGLDPVEPPVVVEGFNPMGRGVVVLPKRGTRQRRAPIRLDL